MYRAVARMLRGNVACLVAGAGILAFVVTTNAEKLTRGTPSVGTPEVIESAVNADRPDRPIQPDGERNRHRAVPRRNSYGGGGSSSIAAGPSTSQAFGFEPGEGFAVGFIDGQVGWATLAENPSVIEPHVEDANPGAGVQHLRLGHDAGQGVSDTIGAVSPNMGGFTDTSAVVSVEVFLTGVTTRDFRVVPQSLTEDLAVTEVRFRRQLNIIQAHDDSGVLVDTGAFWIPDQYVNLTIDLDAAAGTIEISYNGVVIHTNAVLPGATSVQEVAIFGTNGGGGNPGTADFDDLIVTGGPLPTGACCNFDGMSGCEDMTQDDCTTAGGTYLGNGALCSACPMGACCNLDGMDGCGVITPEECSGIVDAFYLGDGTLCVDCPLVDPACGPGAGDCLVAHAGPGCDDVGCCALVCELLDFCCDFSWDQDCVNAALDKFCVPDPGCGIPGTLSCTDGNGTPFCDDTCGVEGPCPGCCEIVCAVDPFCCAFDPFPAGVWDALCDGEAADLCGCKPGAGPANDECLNAVELFVGPAVMIETFCGTPGGPDHAGCNDGFVVGLGIDVWFFYNATFDGALNVIPTPDDDLTWNTQLAVYEGCECEFLEDPPFVCAPIDGTATVPVTNGACYLIRLGGTFDGATGSGLLELAAVPAACTDAANDCLTPSGTGGCTALSCCAQVCFATPACCTVAWDQACVDDAQINCEPLPCPALDTGGANVIEGEVCGLDTNGGCNTDPAPPFNFTEIVSGDVVAGTAWADLASRDTDWYRLTIDPAADVNLDGMVDVHYSLVSELPMVGFLIRDIAATCGPDFNDPTLVSTTAYSQSCICISPGIGTVGINDVIYVFAATGTETGGTIFEGYPCGLAEGPPPFGNGYLYSIDVTDNGVPSPQECSGAAVPCPWDCEPVPDGAVGINDFLGLLAQWGNPGTCDFDGGGVGINDFLDLLAHWGVCP